ncbi:MAG TPA: Tol-Pal system beta propeller repeat protein TolB [Blastocatellia bacterium]|nr:Tol-Pal system beta propeller repeat protein TolB [Blastocatellia bacterium]
MKFIKAIVPLFALAPLLLAAPASVAVQEPQPPPDLRKQIGQIIVTPGSGPNLAVADFIARSAGIDAAVSAFNQALEADVQFAAVAAMVGKSLHPRTLVPDPASLNTEAWSADPVKADYVAFGNLQNSGGALVADTYLYDVKTKQQLIASRHSGDARRMAHEFADEIVKLLTGRDGIATSKLAFVAGDSIRVMDYDGFNQRGFASDGPLLRFPQYSPDGRYLAYVSYKSGVPNIVVRSAEGALVGGTSFNSTTSSPSISPSGELAFSSAISGDGSMEIYVANLDGSGARRLTRTSKAVNISPRWNPKTGREIAFISDRGGSPQIYVMDSSGANQRPLIARGGHSDSPSWSPDGRYVAFTYGGAGSFQIFVADVASGQVLQLTSQGRSESPAWSPDGRHLAFQSSRSGRWEIWQMHIDGSEQRQITRGGGRLPTWAK